VLHWQQEVVDVCAFQVAMLLIPQVVPYYCRVVEVLQCAVVKSVFHLLMLRQMVPVVPSMSHRVRLNVALQAVSPLALVLLPVIVVVV
jgi:hypothetical protein